jgi:hypothetical protein
MASPIDKVRYRYVFGENYFYFLASSTGILFSIVYSLFINLFCDYILWDLWVYALIVFIVSPVLSYFVIRFFFKLSRMQNIMLALLGCVFAVISILSLYTLFFSNESDLILVSIMFLFLVGIGPLYFYITVGRIRILPNRIYINKLELRYDKMVLVKWGVGEVARNLTAEMKQKNIEVLTPIVFEESGEDFTIYHYYTIIEMPTIVYVAQALYFRNSLPQNIRNGWIETWRWDGSTVMPEGWEPDPEKAHIKN